MNRAVVAAPLVVWALGCGTGTGAGTPGEAVAARAPAAPSSHTPWGERAVARVGEGYVTAERLDRAVRAEERQSAAQGRAARDRAAVLEDLVTEELLVQRALRQGVLANDPDVRERLIARLLVVDGVEAKLRNPTAEELRRFHAEHAQEFPREDVLRVRHILISVPADASAKQVDALRRKAERLRGEAAANPNAFPELARRSSDDASAPRGGEVGRLPADRWASIFGEDFPRVAEGVAVGQVGPVIRSKQGLHVFQIVERVPKDSDPLTLHRGEIVARWQEQARRDRRAKLAALAREEIGVEIVEPVAAASR